MPLDADQLAEEVFQVKVALLYIAPEIWRSLLVRPNITLRRFSDTIIIAMGWNGSHLHEFQVGKELYGEPDHDHDAFRITRRQDDRKVQLHRMLQSVGSEATYTYDFGDDWRHSIVLEKRLKADPAVQYPICIGGEMACPPDDCLGPPGYFDLVARRAYDPAPFSLEATNAALRTKKWRAGNAAE